VETLWKEGTVISRFFINRPIFAAVLSIIVTLSGAIALLSLPIAQYPDIAPPTITVSAIFPGANAQVVRDTVAAPIEQQVNGVENMLYMSSQCTNDGMYNLTITFKLGTDLNMAQVLVQNRVTLAMPLIPSLVQREGVSVKKKPPSTMMIVNLLSDKDPASGQPRYDNLYLSNYATIQIKDELSRLSGVGDVAFMGQRDYSMRIWLDPDRMAALGLSADDVVQAVEEQNVQVAVGTIGQEPVPPGQAFQLTLTTVGRLLDPEQFADIILKVTPPASTPQGTGITRLRDVARIELGAQQYDQSCTLDQEPAVALSIYQLPGSNAISTAGAVYAKMEELAARFPDGLHYKIVYDTTPFIRQSITEVFKTLRDAILLVALVVLLFLQNWRATIIPLVAVPVAIIGTFAVMAGMGFSLNNLSLFGLVLAIGIVVDDAIVVVENVERWLEQGLTPGEAARRAMDEVTGPVIAVALVLCAVFVPCAFISGITGVFFRQFAVTIAVSTVISALNSLTLSPALAALLLRPAHAVPDPLTRLLNRIAGGVFRAFNSVFELGTDAYARSVARILRRSAIALTVYVGLLLLTYWSFVHAPTGFVPEQDKGYLLVNVQLPDAASVGRTREVMAQIEEIARAQSGVKHTVGISGQSLLLNTNAPNLGSMYVMLDDFSKRRHSALSGAGIADALRAEFRKKIRDAAVGVFGAPPIDGLGSAGGFKLMIEDRSNLSAAELQKAADSVVDQGNSTPGLQGLFSSGRLDTPWLYLDIDRTKAMTVGVPVSAIFDTLQSYSGSYYVNNFNQFGRTWQVNLMADGSFRARSDDLLRLQVRNKAGKMVPLSTVMTVRDTTGPMMLMRYNMYSATAVNGNMQPGTSSGGALALMDKIAARQVPSSMSAEWTDLAFMERAAGSTAIYVFALAVIFVFLVLAAQYESWSLPLAVILVVPMCLLCSIVGVAIARLDVNIFTQIGFVVLVGLASKNAILIVEFARQKQRDGMPPREATVEACRLRLRPILMTSFAFILGVVPLVLAQGAGSEMRQTLGIAVFSGMLGVTLFGIFLTPVFYSAIMTLLGSEAPSPKPEPASAITEEASPQ
jgi:hydrophobe/amphiphile efflux-1 (HAE1) family protein